MLDQKKLLLLAFRKYFKVLAFTSVLFIQMLVNARKIAVKANTSFYSYDPLFPSYTTACISPLAADSGT